MSAHGGQKAVLAALAANTGIAITKFAAWAITGGAASSMLAEAIHSVADAGNQALLLVGAKRAKRDATPEHPFGFGRERYIYAFLVAIVLFSLGGLFALYEAYHKWHETHERHANELLDSRWWWLPLVVLGAAIVMEAFSFRTAIHESNAVRGTQSWAQFVRRAKAPELPVILLEDLAALLGLVLAFVGISLTLVTDNGYFDAAGTACIGVLLVTVAIILALETKSLLLGESASPEAVQRIRTALATPAGVEGIIHLRTLHLGPEELLVAAKIAVGRTDSALEVARAIDEAEAAVRAAEPTATTIYLEPDIAREPAAS
jgi:cation diffusion facilitator family transporter